MSPIRSFVLGVLPIPDLLSRYRVRGLAVTLITWEARPGEAATGEQAAQLALAADQALGPYSLCYGVRHRIAGHAVTMRRQSDVLSYRRAAFNITIELE